MHWTINGFCHTADGLKPSEWDLFMAPEKKSIWINIYESIEDGELFTDAMIYKTKFAAINGNESLHKYIKTIEITNEV